MAINDHNIKDNNNSKDDSNVKENNHHKTPLINETQNSISSINNDSNNTDLIDEPIKTASIDTGSIDTASIDNIAHRTFLQGYWGTFVAAMKDPGVLLMLIIAPLIYGFFYPWPYQSEVVLDIPVGIVDQDNSSLSDKIVSYSAASPRLEVYRFVNQGAAMQAVYQGDIYGYLIIPPNLEKQVYASQPAHVSIVSNNSYFLINRFVQTGFTSAVGTVSAGVEVRRNVAQGAYLPTAKTNTQAVPLRIDPMFNHLEGYGAYVVPAVSLLILQQTLLMGTALLLGTWYEKRRQYATIRGWLGRIMALATLTFIMGCFYYGWVFSIQDYPRGHNMTGTLIFLAIYTLSTATLGCLLGLIFKERERGMQILIFTALPMFFISGYPWPVTQLPLPLQYIRWLFPATSGINASVQLNQIGASLAQVSHYLCHLTALGLAAFLLILLLQHYQIKRLRR